MTAPPDALRRLLAGAIDYAGLFPPAALSMPETLVRYGTYLLSPQSWALGRLVLPASRLADLRKIIDPQPADRRWELSLLVGPDIEGDVARSRELSAASPGLHVAALETSAPDADAIARLAERLEAIDVPVYVEIGLGEGVAPALDAIRRAGLRAKARTGGVTASAIPPADAVWGFLEACFRAEVGFKVTAGLHHAVRGSHALTYEPDSARATLHGFLNVFVAAALLAAGVGTAEVLQEDDGTAFRFDDGGLAWRDRRAGLDAIARARTRLQSFGSCSFDEPMRELQSLGLA